METSDVWEGVGAFAVTAEHVMVDMSHYRSRNLETKDVVQQLNGGTQACAPCDDAAIGFFDMQHEVKTAAKAVRTQREERRIEREEELEAVESRIQRQRDEHRSQRQSLEEFTRQELRQRAEHEVTFFRLEFATATSDEAVCLATSASMAMLRSAARFKHLWAAGDKQYVGCWESVPRRYGNALGPVSYANRTPVPKDWVLRGSGIHGPENGEVMKLVLWNRLKQKRPQRQGVTTADLQEFYRMEVTVVWWMFGLVFFVAPLNWWGKKYRMVHDHYPWMAARIDGTRGVGPYAWFFE
ncbi:hypothetical protein AK812_SmicGene22401 [Symbiodinium microadriaticum]|uniref:Transmembrane protein n=1 Tax=Symbiodinium microadriaticum TaxID=2951 RepID=A0A1Q9DJV5_SYMMI|nr:hypothetical protein AK812_SmicGene22401 [Symbiodinium microadriaticum]